MTNAESWDIFRKRYAEFPAIGLAVDTSRMNYPDDFFSAMEPRLQQAFAAMAKLEGGDVSNPDEHRMVGHYWLRNAALAPTPEIRREIEETLRDVKEFSRDIHRGTIVGPAGKFKKLLVIGIGGSALGPEFVANALSRPGADKMEVYFFDNTDPDGMDRALAQIGKGLARTLCVVISKSGGTKETRNGMIEARSAFEKAGLDFAKHAVAVTGAGSELDRLAVSQNWLRRFPMWDWVGGRTSETSAVGLVPAALQGFNIEEILSGARACDEATRQLDAKRNPAALLAEMWFYVGKGRG
jgi:glucose-6-phosphate isomerase